MYYTVDLIQKVFIRIRLNKFLRAKREKNTLILQPALSLRKD
jgi:hypothetical protein